MMQVADEAIAFAKGEAVANDGPDHRNNGHHGKALHHGRKHIFLAHQAAIKEGEPRTSHHQNKSGTGQHPGVVGRTLGIGNALFEFGKAFCLGIRA